PALMGQKAAPSAPSCTTSLRCTTAGTLGAWLMLLNLGIVETSVAVRDAPVLCKEIAVLLAKGAIEP
ncbi:hypothetical protein M9458_007916, partial [Cirrhinus mrigala]